MKECIYALTHPPTNTHVGAYVYTRMPHSRLYTTAVCSLGACVLLFKTYACARKIYDENQFAIIMHHTQAYTIRLQTHEPSSFLRSHTMPYHINLHSYNASHCLKPALTTSLPAISSPIIVNVSHKNK